MKRVILGFLCCAALAASATLADAATTLRLSHAYTDGDARDLWADHIAELVRERTNGEVVIQVFPNQQLAKAQAQADSVARNRIDMSVFPLPWLSGRSPATELGALPGLVSSPKDGVAWRQRAIWPLLEKAVSDAGVVLGGAGWAMGTIGSKDKPIILPADLAGQKVRGLGKASEHLMHAEGATITSVPASEIYQSLQTGMLTGVMTIYASFEGYNLNEVTRHLMTGPGFVGAMHALILAPGLEKKVGADNYKIILEAIADSEPWFAERSIEDSERIVALFRDAGVTIHELSAEQVKAWHDASREHAWTYFQNTVPNGKEILEAVDQAR